MPSKLPSNGYAVGIGTLRCPREPFNAWSHGLGALGFGVYGLALLSREPAVDTVAFVLGGSAMLLASAAYHTWDLAWLRRLDHAAIGLMVAGSYTPLAVRLLDPPEREAVLVAQWFLALVGLLAAFALAKSPTALRLALSLLMGWMALAVLGPILQRATAPELALMLAGGLSYTVGSVIYGLKKPDPWPQRVGSHGLWHLFVLVGVACHAAMIWSFAARTVGP